MGKLIQEDCEEQQRVFLASRLAEQLEDHDGGDEHEGAAADGPPWLVLDGEEGEGESESAP